MKNLEKSELKKWIDIWQKASTSLEDIKKEELRDSNYYNKNQALLNEMLNYAFKHRSVRLTSGLIEQQKIFMKYHQK